MKRPASLASTISVDNAEGIATQPIKRRRIRISSKWTVIDPPTLPYLYLKEKTSAVIFNDSPQEIANRIVATAIGVNCIGEYDDVRVSPRNYFVSSLVERYSMLLLISFVIPYLSFTSLFRHELLYR